MSLMGFPVLKLFQYLKPFLIGVDINECDFLILCNIKYPLNVQDQGILMYQITKGALI